jgi:carboxymethylenebutenolidase
VTGSGVGVVGFCMGGSLALWSGTLAPNVVAAVGFYPAIPWDRMRPVWDNYQGKSAMIHCSEEDGTSAAEGIQLAWNAITAAGGDVEVFDYPGTHHAFFNDHRPEVHDPKAAEVGWERTLGLLRRRLAS